MKLVQVRIGVKHEPRGNRHGFTASDYASAAAAEINTEFDSRGEHTWPSEDEKSIAWSVDSVEREIESCDEMFRALLFVEQTPIEIEIED